jgi:hypothetical protein
MASTDEAVLEFIGREAQLRLRWLNVSPTSTWRGLSFRIGTSRLAFDLQLAMVIDPSMFDKPVLLSTWLAAQENKSCRASAHMSSYSIQPASAYTPASYAATSFTTDPTYAATHQTLIDYKNYTTCP